jgi:hypothetical protein
MGVGLGGAPGNKRPRKFLLIWGVFVLGGGGGTLDVY